MSDNDDVRDNGQYLTFNIGDEQFAVGILRVKEIIQYDLVTRIPHLPATIRGVINLRGGIVPVIDLGFKFNGNECSVTRSTCIIIVETMQQGQTTVMGILADSVSEVINFGGDDIELPPEFGTSIRVDFLRGLGKFGKGFVLILDIDRVLGHNELLANAVAAAAAAAGLEAPAEAGNALAGATT